MKTDNVIQLHGLSRKEAERYIQEIARDSKRVFLSKHAKERMVERGVTRIRGYCLFGSLYVF